MTVVMTTNLYRSVNDGTRTDRAVRLLTELITSGKLSAGDYLPSEPALSKQLGISRPTVRLALRTLETRGLVAIRQGIGAQVTDRTRQAATDSIGLMVQQSGGGIRDILEIRLVLECEGAALAAERATADDVQAIHDILDAMHGEALSVEQRIDLDLAFHLRLHETSKNSVLVALIHAIRDAVRNAIAEAFSFDHRNAPRIREHTLLYQAITAHDPAAARTVMAIHLQQALVRYPSRWAPPSSESN